MRPRPTAGAARLAMNREAMPAVFSALEHFPEMDYQTLALQHILHSRAEGWLSG